MWSFIIAESAIFTIFVVAYLFLSRERASPVQTPRDVLEVPDLLHVCLLSSSVTIHLAGKASRTRQASTFAILWLLTIGLGATFMYGTAQEWHRLIYEHGLTISTNLFGTTYYSLVGLHACHVTLGLAMLTTMLLVSVVSGARAQAARIDVLSLYWHFVDGVWIVVFTVVYVIGR
jgi:cytochrome c oxidase subunit 3/cytochrome o ubiquinol oxidase subunit 3